MEAPVTFVLENLKQLLLHHYNLIDGAKDDLEQLMNELDRIKAYLQDASKIQNRNDSFKIAEKQIREVVWDVEDAIDTYVTDATTKNLVTEMIRQNRLGNVVKSLREKKVRPLFNNFIDLSRLSDTGGDTFQARADNRRNKEPRQDKVVGFEDVTEELIRILNEEANEVEVISIIGMPGLGKTTVAWKIYQDERIKYEFPTLIWLFISQEFKKRDMLLTILKTFRRRDMSSNTDAQLVSMVKNHLMNGKFLIFMDDIWTPRVWNEIKEVLPMENKKGKVLITSRDETVALHANRVKDPYMLRFLTEKESWELLQLEVYGKVDNVDEGLEQVGRTIAKQCDGLPLSIIVIGGILVDKRATPGGSLALKEEWRKVSKSVETYLYGDREKVLEEIISLSYTQLPYDLRDCFLYLGMFPEDPEIQVWKLTKLWIAEGFVQPKEGFSLEEVAQDNLKDLINRNLIMVHNTKPHGEVKTCRVHDTIRQFCKKGAAFMFQEIKKNNGIFEPAFDSIDGYRRLCVHSDVHEFLRRKPKLPKARTFLCLSKAPIILSANEISKITDDFKLLRVFEASKLSFPKYPAKITTLLHLRYLTLSCETLNTLPEAIAKLWNLQTLIVVTSSRTFYIKASIWKMMQLRHLKTKASVILMKAGAGEGGENLQTLSRLSPESCTDEVFNKANNLNTLGIRGDLSKFTNPECLKQLELLKKLKLMHDALGAANNPVTNLPPHKAFPPNLRILVLSRTNLEWKHMFTLGQLDSLAILKLKDRAFTGKVWDASCYRFAELEFLYIDHADFEYWTTTAEVFPKLANLVIKNCEGLKEVPFELKANLKLLSLERVTPFAVASARKIDQAKTDRALQRGQRGGFKLQIAPGESQIF